MILGGLLLLNDYAVSLHLFLLLIKEKAAHRLSETFLLICMQSGSTQPQKLHGNSERQVLVYFTTSPFHTFPACSACFKGILYLCF